MPFIKMYYVTALLSSLYERNDYMTPDSISDIVEFEELLKEKVQLFYEYEKITEEMLKIPVDDMLVCVNDRQNLAHEIDALDAELAELYRILPNAGLHDIVLNRIDWGDCPTEYRVFYELGQQLLGHFTRIAAKEDQISYRIREQKDDLLKLIKEQNQGATARAVKYYGTVKQSEEEYRLFDNKY